MNIKELGEEVVRMRDVEKVEIEEERKDNIVQLKGQEGKLIGVYKKKEENKIEMEEEVRKELK